MTCRRLASATDVLLIVNITILRRTTFCDTILCAQFNCYCQSMICMTVHMSPYVKDRQPQFNSYACRVWLLSARVFFTLFQHTFRLYLCNYGEKSNRNASTPHRLLSLSTDYNDPTEGQIQIAPAQHDCYTGLAHRRVGLVSARSSLSGTRRHVEKRHSTYVARCRHHSCCAYGASPHPMRRNSKFAAKVSYVGKYRSATTGLTQTPMRPVKFIDIVRTQFLTLRRDPRVFVLSLSSSDSTAAIKGPRSN